MLFPLQFVQAQTKDYSNDVQSVDSIIGALYNVISGEANDQRDWERFMNLFAVDARLIPSFKSKDGKVALRSLTPAQYAESFSKNMKTGFFEGELFRVTNEYGNIVHVFSTYETREQKGGPVTMRGINSIQLLKTELRYYVVNIFWSGETKENPIPEKYLKGS
jgi:hypothetical protein